MKNKSIFIFLGLLLLVIVVITTNFGSKQREELTAKVKEGRFEIAVMTVGEVEAKTAMEINAPSELRSAGLLFKIKIADLVPEGTIVKEGDFIANLEKTEVIEKVRSSDVEIKKLQNQYQQALLDTAITLRAERDALANLKYLLSQKENYLSTLKYEAAAQIKSAQIDVQKTKESYQRAYQNYYLKRQQASTKIQEVGSLLVEAQRKQGNVKDLLGNFVIKAPSKGMVIYARNWKGEKKTIGSEVDAFDPVVATLPNMSKMISRTYVSEIDISRIKVGHDAIITIDAFPAQKLKGKVASLGNVGETRPGYDGKVFEVLIDIIDHDPKLKPTMSTQNKIICFQAPKALLVPLEAIHTAEDDRLFVFVQRGRKVHKQQVRIAQTNDMYGVVVAGLQKDDLILLAPAQQHYQKKLRNLASKPQK